MTKTPIEIAEQIIKRYSPALILSTDEQDILALAKAYKDVTQWIPVGERLPEVSCRGEYGNWVLVNNGFHTGAAKLVGWEDGENPEWEDVGWGEQITPPPTHWMPLPLPPKQEE